MLDSLHLMKSVINSIHLNTSDLCFQYVLKHIYTRHTEKGFKRGSKSKGRAKIEVRQQLWEQRGQKVSVNHSPNGKCESHHQHRVVVMTRQTACLCTYKVFALPPSFSVYDACSLEKSLGSTVGKVR